MPVNEIVEQPVEQPRDPVLGQVRGCVPTGDDGIDVKRGVFTDGDDGVVRNEDGDFFGETNSPVPRSSRAK